MTERKSKSGLAAAAFILAGFGCSEPAWARGQEPHPAPPVHAECAVNLALAGQMADIVSNALVRGLKVPSGDVRSFLTGAEKRYETGPELLTAAAVHFGIGEDVLTAKVEKYRHCNCTHPVESTLQPALRVDPGAHPECTVDLTLAGQMSDILSNALTLGLHVPEPDVRAFLDGADETYEDGPAVLAATAARFEMNEDALAAEVLKFKHVNCRHAGGGESASAAVPPDDGLPVSAFAKDVTLHVVLHELGHALIREFDLLLRCTPSAASRCTVIGREGMGRAFRSGAPPRWRRNDTVPGSGESGLPHPGRPLTSRSCRPRRGSSRVRCVGGDRAARAGSARLRGADC